MNILDGAKRVKDNPNFIRTKDGYILNLDSVAYSSALKRKKKINEYESRIQKLELLVEKLLENQKEPKCL
jgi:hypothetical protein